MQADFLIDGEKLPAGRRPAGLCLAHAGHSLEAKGVSLPEELHRFRSQDHRLAGEITERVQPCEIGVRGRHGGGEDEASLCHLDFGGLLLGEGRCQGGAVLAPEIQLPGEIERGLTVVMPALRQSLTRNEIVVGLLALGEIGLPGDLGEPCRARILDHGGCRVHTRLRNRKIG